MELQNDHKAKDNERRGFAGTFSKDNEEQQYDVLARLGKLPVLKVQLLSWRWEDLCKADTHSATSGLHQFWALPVPS